jgi:dynein heavy chain
MRVLKMNLNLIQNLQENNKSLEEITRALQEYMERKRSEFPRFYFLSDDELLEILANSDKVSEVIMLHLKTLFDNLVFLEIKEGEIFKMYSREQEECAFTKPVKVKAEVQAWLLDVQKEMMFTI